MGMQGECTLFQRIESEEPEAVDQRVTAKLEWTVISPAVQPLKIERKQTSTNDNIDTQSGENKNTDSTSLSLDAEVSLGYGPVSGSAGVHDKNEMSAAQTQAFVSEVNSMGTSFTEAFDITCYQSE